MAIRVSDKKNIYSCLHTYGNSENFRVELLCPIRRARIYCHSFLIDNLSDLTVFVISSLYAGYSIDEIDKLTLMGNAVISEELKYLYDVGLITDMKDPLLTDLGKQYGELLKQFSDMSDGIVVSFNSFTNRFEPFIEGISAESNVQLILKEQFVSELTRNDNYSNSKEVAVNHIHSDMPFCSEILNSLYTTVRIENRNSEHGYKKLFLTNLDYGKMTRTNHDIAIAIPVDIITCKFRYNWIDKYREVIPLLKQLFEFNMDLLSNEATLVLHSAIEEQETDCINIFVNMINGKIIPADKQLLETVDDNSIMLDKREFTLTLDPDKCNGIYLEEINRETFHSIKFFSYERLEDE